MALPVELDPRAEDDARAAFLWYLERSERAAIAFEREIESAIDQIGEAPTVYPIVDGELRRFLLERFPYAMLYSIGATCVRALLLRISIGSRGIGAANDGSHLAKAGGGAIATDAHVLPRITLDKPQPMATAPRIEARAHVSEPSP